MNVRDVKDNNDRYLDKTDYVIDDVDDVNVNVNCGAAEIFLMHLIVDQISLGRFLALNVPEQVIHHIKEHDVVPRVAYGN